MTNAEQDMTKNRAAGRELDALVAERVMGWVVMANITANAEGLTWCTPLPAADIDKVFRPGARELVRQITWDDARQMKTNNLLHVNQRPCGCVQASIPRYSTDISAAWTVVEKMRERTKGQAAQALYYDWAKAIRQVLRIADCYEASHVAGAICRAALSAVASSGRETPNTPTSAASNRERT